MEKPQLTILHEEMLAREEAVYAKQQEIKNLEKEIQEGQSAYVFLRDQYVSILKNIVTSKGLTGLMLQKTITDNHSVKAIINDVRNAQTIEEITSLLDEHLPVTTEYERLAIVYAVMTKGGKLAEKLQRLLLVSYRQEVATCRILLNS